ncbi:hypothetical protein LWP59_34710 [Amycolatopsis acidiphila]|uniref:Uncharacterized protein n=1 Tax=Amycolatopsis acidiphila TaxID=715473 RepID=A0A557ZRM5_9PSEU|nr:hypothetical protein [Amycolatopsis acidiphila]TVT14676.1 hypothetical protein FNH06_37380 [Amycolatopsis acidiphila]UIJ59155.1 hypothetical protein LWP59_34710 [Amycolatopsis acidiphila]GHG78812.1 hypothetical protein GCM10017788_46300 [Amycolatopsis acidiphila]
MPDIGRALQAPEVAKLEDVLHLPRPAEAGYEGLKAPQVAANLEDLMGGWKRILERDTSFDDRAADPTDIRWRQASLRIASHFAYALPLAESAYATREYRGWSPFFGCLRNDLLSADFGIDAAIERRFISEFFVGYHSTFIMENTGSVVLGLTGTGYDLFVHWAMEHLSQVALHSPHREHLAMAHIFIAALAKRARQAVDQRDENDLKRRDQLWGHLIGSLELGDLARRSEEVIRRHGDKQVEERFEQQLSILLQSFGFIVVSTSRGERRVDLICIASQGGGAPYTLLVEAKSTARPYALPTKHSRALQEYVDNVKHKLTTLPPLKLLLIVGPEPAKTLSQKLTDLENLASTPVRYCPAGSLAHLRRILAGAVPAGVFLDALLSAPKVVGGEQLHQVVSHVREQAAAHRDFVRRML